MREMLISCHLCDCSPVQQEKGYSSLQDEAVKIFNSLQEIETVSDPIPIIQGILQTCHDLKPLRDEVYCQLIKQTNHMPHPNSTGNLHHWQLMSCMSCTFLPSRGILRYLKFHLRRYSPFHMQPVSFLSAYILLHVVVSRLTLLCKHLPVVRILPLRGNLPTSCFVVFKLPPWQPSVVSKGCEK